MEHNFLRIYQAYILGIAKYFKDKKKKKVLGES